MRLFFFSKSFGYYLLGMSSSYSLIHEYYNWKSSQGKLSQIKSTVKKLRKENWSINEIRQVSAIGFLTSLLIIFFNRKRRK